MASTPLELFLLAPPPPGASFSDRVYWRGIVRTEQ